jgi:pimeloyl-ACP methyl ester carboxylesterase
METTFLPGERHVRISVGEVTIDADLAIPDRAIGLVAFAHGSGSNRHSPRNRYVATVMYRACLATLLLSILTVEEESSDLITGTLRFDVGLLARRLAGITDWLLGNEHTQRLKLGLFGSSTGAAGALLAAAERPDAVAAIVSRGGRPDLAAHVLGRVRAPTLLIVGGQDYPVIDMNRGALAGLTAEKKLVIVPGATHLFEEPGTLEQVAEMAKGWFVKYLGGR